MYHTEQLGARHLTDFFARERLDCRQASSRISNSACNTRCQKDSMSGAETWILTAMWSCSIDPGI
eukprot:6209505-Pleurochrysis_carterae.AAC.1